jgi:hypothetical protein
MPPTPGVAVHVAVTCSTFKTHSVCFFSSHVVAEGAITATLILEACMLHVTALSLPRVPHTGRYMWLPYTDAVVVVSCNELEGDVAPPVTPWNGAALEPLRALLKDLDVRIAA